MENLKSITYNLEPKVTAYYGYDIADKFYDVLNKYRYDKIFFIAEEFIYNLHGRKFIQHLADNKIKYEVLLIQSSEMEKTFKNVDYICNKFIKHKISKDSIIVSFGGGVVGNISGLVAGLIYRGVQYIEIPTTFMGMTDSSLSNKQAVNGDSGKNQIGRYYAPLFIWSDLKYIETENARNTKAAIVEGVKNTLIQDKKILKDFADYIYRRDSFDKESLMYLFETITQSKNRILERDPSEKEYCVILEYGHTFGHAIEFLSAGKIIHGEAVAIGMCVAAEISKVLGKISREDVELHYNILGDLIFRGNSSIDLIRELKISDIIKVIESDNKRTSVGIKYVILDEIGKCSVENEHYQIQVQEDIVVDCMKKAFERIYTIEEEQVFEKVMREYKEIKKDSVDDVLKYYFEDSIEAGIFKNAFVAHIGIYIGDYIRAVSIDKLREFIKRIESETVENVEDGPTYISPKHYGTPGWWYSFKLKEDASEVELFTCKDYGEWSTFDKNKKRNLMSHYAIGVNTLEQFHAICEQIMKVDSYEQLELTESDSLGHTYVHFRNGNSMKVIEIIYKEV